MSISIAEKKRKDGKNWERDITVEGLTEFQIGTGSGKTQMEMAEELGIPRTTLRDWESRKKQSACLSEAETAFFETPEGLACLHRICLAAHTVIVFQPEKGIRGVCAFLELSGLSMFTGNSYGAQQKIASEIEMASVHYESAQKNRLVPVMPERQVTICEDETFHPDICLVCMEPVSGFILAEEYVQHRDAETWNTVLEKQLQGMPVEVIQIVSDGAIGIINHAVQKNHAHHSPDLFHIQQDNVRGLYPALENHHRQACMASEEMHKELEGWKNRQAVYENPESRPPGRAPDFEHHIHQAELAYREAVDQVEAVEDAQKEVKQAIAGIRNDYHPYDLHTGKSRSIEDTKKQLEGHFDTLERVADEAGVSEKGRAKLRKARRLLPSMLATLAFFFMAIKSKIDALCLPAESEQLLYDSLIPAYYLERVAEQAQNAEQRNQLLASARDCLNDLGSPGHPWHALDNETRQSMERTARDCANIFQRSSSCVEGHNGELALWHHHLHCIRPRRLQAITIFCNYMVEKGEITAAEQFFGAKPDDLFEWLVKQVRLPPRPAKKRETAKQGIWPDIVGHA